MSTLHYVGQELDVFAHATNWKRYWSSVVQPFIKGDVLEVGAGLGVNTPFLKPRATRSWTCLEPDPALAARLETSLKNKAETAHCKTIIGTTRSFGSVPQFDALLYIDVLEHIEDDRGELEYAARLLRPKGSLIVLSPAHPWLYTPFDKSIGHVRRYTRRTLAGCVPPSCHQERLIYLDSCGMLASLGNRLLLQQSDPTLKQIHFWDQFLVPPSAFFDHLTRYTLGKSVLAIWTKQGN